MIHEPQFYFIEDSPNCKHHIKRMTAISAIDIIKVIKLCNVEKLKNFYELNLKSLNK